MNIIRKLLHFSLFAFIASLFMECHPYEEIIHIKLYNYKAKDYTTKEIKVYEPVDLLFPILDSILIKTEECPEYQNRKEKVFYYFTVENGKKTETEEYWDYPVVRITVNYYNFCHSDFCSVEGVFQYKDYDFYIDELFVDALLKKTDKTISIRHVSPEKFHHDPLYRGERDMYWVYRYQQGALINTSYGRCPE